MYVMNLPENTKEFMDDFLEIMERYTGVYIMGYDRVNLEVVMVKDPDDYNHIILKEKEEDITQFTSSLEKFYNALFSTGEMSRELSIKVSDVERRLFGYNNADYMTVWSLFHINDRHLENGELCSMSKFQWAADLLTR